MEPRSQANCPWQIPSSTSKLFPSPVDIGPSLNSKNPSWLTPLLSSGPGAGCLFDLTEALAGDRGPGQETHTSSLNPHPCVSTPGLAFRSGSKENKKPGQGLPEPHVPFPSRYRNFVPFGSVNSYVWSP